MEKPNKRWAFSERASSDHNLRPALGNKIQSGVFLEEANRIDSAKNTDGTREANALGPSSYCRENHSRCGIEKFFAMMLPQSEDIESNPVCGLHFSQQFSMRSTAGNVLPEAGSGMVAAKLSIPISIIVASAACRVGD